MSVIVDAESQQVVAKFPASPKGDADLIAYLRTAQLPAKAPQAGSAPEVSGPALEGTDPASTLRRLLRENRAEQRRAAGRISNLEAQERDLRRLLQAAEKGR